MKKLVITCMTTFAVLMLCACRTDGSRPSTPSTPSTPADQQVNKPNPEDMLNGTKLYGKLALADPYIYVDRENSLYYIVGTATPDKGFKAYKSPDLERWVQVDGRAEEGFVLYKTDVTVYSGGAVYSDKDFWAPELYKVSDWHYLMFYSADEHVYVAEADSPIGPFEQNTLGFTPSSQGIDNSLFIDSDGRAYMYWVRFNNGNVIYVAELDESFTSIKTSTMRLCFQATQSWELAMNKINEGPAVFKHNGLYYMVYSGNDYRSQDYGVGVATASSPLGPWTKYDDNPILCRPGGLVGTGHCSVFTDLNGNLKMVFHAHASSYVVNPRQTYITDLSFVNVGGVDKLVASPDYTTCYLYK